MVRSEVLPGPERRRRWNSEEKARIVAELDAPGVRGSDVARRYGVSRSLLYAWVKERKRDTPAAPEIAFAPVVLTEPQGVAPPPAAPAPVALTADRPAIEIETKVARVRLPVDTKPAIVKRLRGLTPIGTAVTLWPTSEDKRNQGLMAIDPLPTRGHSMMPIHTESAMVVSGGESSELR